MPLVLSFSHSGAPVPRATLFWSPTDAVRLTTGEEKTFEIDDGVRRVADQLTLRYDNTSMARALEVCRFDIYVRPGMMLCVRVLQLVVVPLAGGTAVTSHSLLCCCYRCGDSYQSENFLPVRKHSRSTMEFNRSCRSASVALRQYECASSPRGLPI